MSTPEQTTIKSLDDVEIQFSKIIAVTPIESLVLLALVDEDGVLSEHKVDAIEYNTLRGSY